MQDAGELLKTQSKELSNNEKAIIQEFVFARQTP